MNEIIEEKVRFIFRTAGMLNYHVTRGNAQKDRILKDLRQISSLSKQVLELLSES